MASIVLAGICVPAQARPPAPAVRFDVPAQPMATSLRLFARQAGIQILVANAAVKGRVARAVRGRSPVLPALQRLLAGTGVRVLSFDGSVAVLAADHAPPAPPQATEPASEPIVVTGTRIPGEEGRSAMPVRVVRMEQAARAGRTSAYDALVAEPAIGAGIGLNNAFGQAWDAGVSSISLRGLGTNRSLTLIDGMRRVSGSARSSAVDLTMVPAAMIDRIEIITGGATAIYGADAVTGAVNVITRQHVQGASLSATQGLSDRGDARESTVSAATGTRFAGSRGSLALGGTYARVTPLAYAQRYRTYIRSIANPANTGAGDGIPDQITVEDFRQIYFAYQPSFYFNGQSYLVENGTPRPARYDQTYYPGQFSYGDGGDGRNLRDSDQLRGGIEAFSAMGRLDYDLGDDIAYRGYLDFGLSTYRGTASFPRHRDDSRATWFDGAGGSVALLDNPFLPQGLRDFMLANGLDRLAIDRTYGNFPVMQEIHRRRSVTFGHQLEGTLSPTLRWSAFLQYGRTLDRVRTTHVPFASHWLAARDVIVDPQTGQPACRDPEARADGCVPLDIFGSAPPSAALTAYVLGTRKESRRNTQGIAGAHVEGRVLDLPHGALQVVLGAERRVETLRTRDDPLAASEYTYGGSGYTVHPDLHASMRAWEIYGEAKAPLLRDLPLAQSLDLEGAYRYSRYSSVGSTGTWKLGGTWSPVAGLLLRAMRSRSVRVPNFGELYEVPVSRQAGSITDPCEAADYYQSATRSANCRALGILVPLGDIKVGPVITTQGNPDLTPETSNSFTVGAVLRPASVPGTELTVDLWNIDIRDAITQFDYTTILNLCVDLPTTDNLFCGLVRRDPADGRVTAISTSQVNAARLTARGVDIGLAYRLPLGTGALRIDVKGTYLMRHMVESTPGIATGDVAYAGDWEHPRWRGNAMLDLESGRFGATLNLRMLGASRYDISAESAEVFDRNKLAMRLYADASVRWKVAAAMTATLGIRNLTDLRPPLIYPVYKDTTIYDQVGRYIFTSIALDL
ncbi:TonB-dependent receptor domain-containing protein [Novosphingobium soli]|uniref:TonB-dependent receptor domain-containing protein n=1 Tax=Novosphingobium soli TaxID=574956 RepID=A0ABV6CZF8_9SPHN